MKAFKKWEGTHSPGEYAYQKWEESWRAALEFIQSRIELHTKTESYGEDILIAIENDIEDELGEKNENRL